MSLQVEKKQAAAWSSSIDTITTITVQQKEKKPPSHTPCARALAYYSLGDAAVRYGLKLYDVDVYNVSKIPLCLRRYCEI